MRKPGASAATHRKSVPWSPAWWILVLLLLGSPLAASAQEAPDLARAKRAGLNEAELRTLQGTGVVVGRRTWRQVFSPYVYPNYPVFVTSDSVLHGYFVLLEESLLQAEHQNHRRLRRALRRMGERLAREEQTSRYDLPPDVVAEARRRAQVTLATALLLLREPTGDLDPQNVHLAEEEAARVLKSEGLSLPAWLGPPGPNFLALDYGRFRPRGVYSRSPELEEYFRAFSWLQAVPFRLESDPELLAWIMLVQSLQGLARGDEQFLEDFGTLTGQPDDPWMGAIQVWWHRVRLPCFQARTVVNLCAEPLQGFQVKWRSPLC